MINLWGLRSHYTSFVLVWFYDISTGIGYLMPYSLYTYYISIICKHILLIMFLNELILLQTVK